MKKKLLAGLVTGVMFGLVNNASAITMLIGDVDGFGFNNPNQYNSAQGTNPDTNGNGIIEAGEFLPNIAGNSAVNTSDIFDNRDTSEINSAVGAEWTDQSLTGSEPNNASFTFNFNTPTLGDADYNQDHFINFVIGDYDVSPGSIKIDNDIRVNFTLQGNKKDGLAQLAYAIVPWENMLDGRVTIDVIAPSEPYIAVDYAFLNTESGSAQAHVPEPSAMLLLGSGIAGLAGIRRKKK